MMVVGNTSSIRKWVAIGSLDLLQRLADTVQISGPCVTNSRGSERAGINSLNSTCPLVDAARHCGATAGVGSLARTGSKQSGRDRLSPGFQAELVELDERRGRRVARQLGLTPLGLLGVLVDAKRRGAVAALKPLLDDLIVRPDFGWVPPWMPGC
jgi:predicted nucleic acid-binding protein